LKAPGPGGRIQLDEATAAMLSTPSPQERPGMRIRFPVIRNFSGADIYFERLAQGMAAQGWETELDFYPHLLEFMPYGALRPFLSAEQDCDLVHSKAEYGWLFAR
jgi:hypothetical protein